MSGIEGLQLDADGFVDMDQLPDDDLSEADLTQLRDTLHSDPVEEPTAEQWDAMFDDAVAGADDGPFALEDVDGLVTDDGSSSDDPAAAADPDDADDLDADTDGSDTDGPDGDLFALDGTDDLDLGLDGTDLDGGLDLAPDDTVDDAFSPDALDDAPADVAGNDFEDLL